MKYEEEYTNKGWKWWSDEKKDKEGSMWNSSHDQLRDGPWSTIQDEWWSDPSYGEAGRWQKSKYDAEQSRRGGIWGKIPMGQGHGWHYRWGSDLSQDSNYRDDENYDHSRPWQSAPDRLPPIPKGVIGEATVRW